MNQTQLSNITTTIQTLNTSLASIAPTNTEISQTTQLITYTLIATAVVGIFIYHYIKSQEKLC